MGADDAEISLSLAGPPAAPYVLAMQYAQATKMTEVERIQTGTRALDRVLNGGIPFSSAALISGPPGVGKSTLREISYARFDAALAGGDRLGRSHLER